MKMLLKLKSIFVYLIEDFFQIELTEKDGNSFAMY